jgi:tripartite-type tricarboxylate transporter receptor subunit TctC
VDVLAGTVECIIETLPAALGHIRAGRLRALAVSSATRSIVLPDVPTFTEIGLAEATGVNWFGFCGPPGLPEPVVARWLQELREVLNLPEVRDRLVERGGSVCLNSSWASPKCIPTLVRPPSELMAAR